MVSITSKRIFELFDCLCAIASSPAENCDEIFRKPIQNVYKNLCQDENCCTLLHMLKTEFSAILKLTENVANIVCSKLVELYVDWVVFMLYFYFKWLKEVFQQNQMLGSSKLLPDVLTSHQLKTLRNSLDRVFLLGVSLQLNPGVGLPLNMKISSDPLLLKLLCPQANDLDKNIHFLKATMTIIIQLFEMKETDIFRSYITSHHFNTYLAALLQLSYSPDISDEHFKKYLPVVMLRLPEKCLIKEVFSLVAKQPQETFCGGSFVSPPRWLVFRGCLFLKKSIMKRDGVKKCILALTEESSAQSGSAHCQKHIESVADLISNYPFKKVSSEEYYVNITRQVLDILWEHMTSGSESTENRQKMMEVVVGILEKLSSTRQNVFKEQFLNVFLKALIACSHPGLCQEEIHENEVVSEKELSTCIEKLHELLVISHVPNSSLPSHFLPFVPILFQFYTFSSFPSISFLNSLIQSILVNILKNVDQWKAVSLLKIFLNLKQCPTSLNVDDFYFLSEEVQFALGASGGIKVVLKANSTVQMHTTSKFKESQQKVSCLLQLITTISDQEIAANIFKATLQEFSQISCQEVGEGDDLWHQLLSTGNGDESLWLRNVTLLTFLSDFVEVFCDLCSLNIEDIFPVCQVIMERSVAMMKIAQENSMENTAVELQNEILSFAVGLLTSIIIESKRMTHDKWCQAEPFLPLLRYLSSHHLSQEIRVISYELMEAIATHGKVSDSKYDSTTLNFKDGTPLDNLVGKISLDHNDQNSACASQMNMNSDLPGNILSATPEEDLASLSHFSSKGSFLTTSSHLKANPRRKLIEEISTNERSYYEDSNEILASRNLGPEFKEMLTNVTNFLEPIKGAGLIKMKKLIIAKDPDADNHKILLLKICRSCLCHEDSYIYLSAIEALSSLASRHPDFVVPSLMEDYKKNFEKNHVEIKLKLGEALVKVIKMIGALAVTYKDSLLSTLLNVLKDEDETIKSSSISNLAEVCKLLRFSLSSCLYEIFDIVQDILKFDKSVEVRRAAALLTTQILQGTSKETFHILGDFLPEFYRLLKYTYKTDCDHVVQQHILLSLEELDTIMRNFLFPKPSFEKHIFILDPPSS